MNYFPFVQRLETCFRLTQQCPNASFSALPKTGHLDILEANIRLTAKELKVQIPNFMTSYGQKNSSQSTTFAKRVP